MNTHRLSQAFVLPVIVLAMFSLACMSIYEFPSAKAAVPPRLLFIGINEISAKTVAQQFADPAKITDDTDSSLVWEGKGAALRWAHDLFQGVTVVRVLRQEESITVHGDEANIVVPVEWTLRYRDGHSATGAGKWRIVESRGPHSWYITSLAWTRT
ncbi:MAG: hypothetical protein M3007_05275 [Candidatus Eremiobacteraeota bacterium]|nr:hypothetical protein [Candidatus Eremiobacteraeota bacterium]